MVPPGSRQALSNPDNTVGSFAESDPVTLPDLLTVFARRAERLRALAPGHELEGFLRMLAALVAALDDREWPVRRQAALSLGEIGAAEAKPALQKRTKDENALVRQAAAKALERLR